MNPTNTRTNITSLFELIGRINGQLFITTPIYNGIQCKNSIWPNILFDFPTCLTDLQKELPKLLDRIEKRNLPSVIMFDPDLDHSNSINWLKTKGFRHGTWTGMTAELTQIEKIQSELLIRATTNIEKWVNCVESTLMGNEKLEVSIFEELAKHPSVTLLEGKVEEEIVSTALVFINDTSAGLLLVGTDETCRNKGFGSAITISAKNVAFEKGCSNMYLHATPIGKSTYLKCGFVENGIVDVFDLSKL